MLKGKVAFVSGGSGAVGCGHRASARPRGLPRGLLVQEPRRRGDAAAAGACGRRGGRAVRSARCSRRQGGRWIWPVTIEKEFGPVDILVNNAGATQILPFAMIEEKDWDLIMDVNVKGMFLVTKAFARGMIRRKAGSIINIGSLAGMRMLEVPVHYATAKSAIVGFTLALARELGRYGIRVNAVAPGHAERRGEREHPGPAAGGVQAVLRLVAGGHARGGRRTGRVPGQRPGGYINAQTVLMDGGI